MAKSFSKYLFTIFFVLLTGSCVLDKFHSVSMVNDSLIEKKYINLLNNQYPDSFSMTQRIILNVAGKQYDFIGQLIMKRGKNYRAVAFGEMGGQFIDLLAKKDSISILSNPNNLSEKPILQGVAEDIKQLFYYHSLSNLRSSDLANNMVKVSMNTSDDKQSIYLINSNNYQIMNLNYFSRNKLIRSAEFMEYKKYEGWDRKMPSYIKLTNHRWHYALEIHLLKFSLRYNVNKVFNKN